MSTVDALAVGFKAARQAKAASRAHRAGTRTAGAGARRFARRVGEASLSLAGLGAFTAAAFTVATGVGLAVLGVSLFIAEWRLADGE